MTKRRTLHGISLDKIAAVTEPANEFALAHICKSRPALAALLKSTGGMSEDDRAALEAAGLAMPGGELPIRNRQDVAEAIARHGRAADPAAARAHITRSAGLLGLQGALPADWQDDEDPGGSGDSEEDQDMDDTETAKAAFHAEVAKIAARDGIPRHRAMEKARAANPELVAKLGRPVTAAKPGDDDGDRAAARRRFDDAVIAEQSARKVPRHVAMSRVAGREPALHQAAFGR